MDLTMAFVEGPAGKIFYSVQGKGEPLLMLRGLGRSSRYWLGFEKEMAKHFKVLLIDMRGLGQSTATMNWDATIEDLAADCLAVLTKAKIKSCHVFGLSLGGMVAMAMAIQAPERLRTLVVSSSSTADYLGFRLNPLALQKLFLARLRGGQSFQETLMTLVVAPTVLRSRRPQIEAAWADIIAQEGFPKSVIVKQVLAAARFRLRKRLSADKLPILFIHGGMDHFVPQWNSMQLHRLLKGSEFRSIKSSGHEIAMGHEKELAKVIRDFAEAG
jgi:3-oxoadipate enol-lactonase